MGRKAQQQDKILIYVVIAQGKSVLWCIGILGSAIALLKSNENNNVIEPNFHNVLKHKRGHHSII